jgi:hypothetical protein
VVKIAEEYLREAADSDYSGILVPANQACAHRFAAGKLQVALISFRSHCRGDPRMEKTPAGDDQTRKFIHVTFARMAQINSCACHQRLGCVPGHYYSDLTVLAIFYRYPI